MAIRTTALLILLLHFSSWIRSAEPVKIIYDTDWGPDIDDVAALAILHALADLGEVEVLATVISRGGVSEPWTAPALDAVNTYYGRPDIPIGVSKSNDSPLSDSYTRQLAEGFPNDFGDGRQAPDAVTVYRDVLSRQPDNSVVVVTVGYLTNLKDLLASGADEWSELSGIELIDRKVSHLVAMGGHFPDGGPEWNLSQDHEAARSVFAEWRKPIIFSGFEIGEKVLTGARLRNESPEASPVRTTYLSASDHTDQSGNRSSWDQTAVLFAARGAHTYWDLSEPGSIVYFESGQGNNFEFDETGSHRFLIERMPRDELARSIEDLMIRTPQEGERTIWDEKRLEDDGIWMRDWMGWVYLDRSFLPWVVHNQLGFLYGFGHTSNLAWFFSNVDELAFLYTGSSLYPYIYSSEQEAWLYHWSGTSTLMNLKTGQPIFLGLDGTGLQ